MVKWTELTHFCCTSEDINNLAYAFLIKQCLHTVLLPQYLMIIRYFSSLAQQVKKNNNFSEIVKASISTILMSYAFILLV
jgi:adenylosuccinate lyase